MEQYGNKHYIQTDKDGRILNGWSNGPIPNRDLAGAILLREDGSYQFRLTPHGPENPTLQDTDGIPLYRWDGESALERTEEEIETDRRALVLPEPAPSLEARVDLLETETAAISAAIERGLSL